MKKVLVAGSINMDLVVGVARFPAPGETLSGLSYKEHIGGKGANQASACALQNTPVTIWGKMGSDGYARTIAEAFQKLGIQSAVSYVSLHTGLALIEVSPEGQNRIVVVPGANGLFSKDDVLGSLSLIAEHDILVLQHEIPLDTCALIAAEAKKAGKTVLLNPAPAAELSDKLLKNIDYLIPNEHELALISRMPAASDAEIAAAMKSLTGRGAGCVITTLGERGLCYTEAGAVRFLPAPKVKAVDTTGAGDALVGAFAAYLAKGLPLAGALERGACAASLSVTRFGAFGSAGTETEVERLIQA